MRALAGARAEEIALAVLDLALGHHVQETDKDGKRRIYTRSPDPRAQAMLYDRLDGKITDKIEHSGELTLSIEAISAIRARAGN